MKINIIQSKIKYLLALFVLLLAGYILGSRTQMLVLLVLLVFIAYLFIREKKGLFFMILPVFLFMALPLLNNNAIQGERYLQSLDEIKISDYSNYGDMNDKYRGWEAFQAIKTYSNGSMYEKIMGQGCGALIDLGGIFINDWSKVPVLHNGYPYLLVKTGIFGLICYLLFYLKILHYSNRLRKQHQTNPTLDVLYIVSLSIVASLFATNIVIAGIFNPVCGILSITLGMISQYIMTLSKNTSEKLYSNNR